ncbi:MAG: phage tail protein [Chloroflexi bacterium]|nr:phage tail protein [Chloroflexota bacterium]
MTRVAPSEIAGSWLLDARTGWRTDRPATGPGAGVAIGEELSLAAVAGGPLSLASPDGSLGGLVLPRGVAIDGSRRVYLLSAVSPMIRRFDAETGGFEILATVGGEGTDARRLRAPGNIAATGARLYVADSGNERVQVFDTVSLALLWLGRPRRPWQPVDVATVGNAAYVLDALERRVYRLVLERGRLELAGRLEDDGSVPSRIVVDREGGIHVLTLAGGPESARLVQLDRRGRPVSSVTDPGSVRARFDTPAIAFDHRGRFTLDDDLAQRCPPVSIGDACQPEAADTPVGPSGADDAGRVTNAGGVIDAAGTSSSTADPSPTFDREGAQIRVDRAEPAGPKRFVRAGSWTSTALDSGIHQCQWHRFELELAALPEGASVRVWTATTDRAPAPHGAAPPLTDPAWVPHATIVGLAQGSGQARATKADELAVLSGPGRYLWLRIELSGDAYETPAVRSVRIHFPRRSYLEYLPAVYSAEDESRRFLERFLSVFQTEWDAFDAFVATFARYLDPRAVPDDFVAYLADWLAQPLEGSWSAEQKRQLLAAVVEMSSLRGTVDGLRRYVRAYLENMADLPDDAPPYPRIVEGFRERDRLMLGNADGSRLGNASPLWGPGVVGRLQLDVYAREGEVRLVSTGDPARDVFHEYAHRFRVYVPSGWVRDAEAERMLRRAVDAEKPAHTQYELCLIEPRFRVGVQATVGIDTVVAGYPVAHLRCDQHRDAPSRPPSNRLGYDAVLAAAPPTHRDPHSAPAVRVGLDTRLA